MNCSIHLNMFSRQHHYKHHGMFWLVIMIIWVMFQLKSNMVKHRNDGNYHLRIIKLI